MKLNWPTAIVVSVFVLTYVGLAIAGKEAPAALTPVLGAIGVFVVGLLHPVVIPTPPSERTTDPDISRGGE